MTESERKTGTREGGYRWIKEEERENEERRVT